MMARLWLVAAVTLGIVTASCTGQTETAAPRQTSAPTSPSTQPSPTLQPVTDFASLATGLEAAGYAIRVEGRTGLEDAFGVRGQSVRIDGMRVMAFEYPTAAAASKLRSSVKGPNAEFVGDAIIEWCCPHLYACGSLIVVYLGDQPAAIRTLDQLLGPQFAGV
jgi:hypothetical protein